MSEPRRDERTTAGLRKLERDDGVGTKQSVLAVSRSVGCESCWPEGSRVVGRASSSTTGGGRDLDLEPFIISCTLLIHPACRQEGARLTPCASKR